MARSQALVATLLISLLAVACIPERERRGDINLIFGMTGQERALFEVEQGRILSQWLDVATEAPGPDACVRGTWNNSPVSLCPSPLDPADSHFGGKLVRWHGPSGELAVEVSPSGKAMRVDGWVSRNSGAGVSSADASVHGLGGGSSGRGSRDAYRLGQGREVPAAQRGLHITLPLGRGPQWDEMRRYPVLYALAAASLGLSSGEGVRPALQPSEERQGESAPPPSAPPTAPPGSTN